MTHSRRTVLTAGVAAAAVAGVGTPLLVRAQARPPREARMVPHGDLNVLDPIWTTQNMAAYHGAIGVLYERRHTRLLADYGGLWKSVPVFCFFFLVLLFLFLPSPTKTTK